MDKVQVIKFNDGGTLIYQKTNRNKATSVAVGFNVGFLNNTQNGIAHFCEHMLFKGTNKRSREQLEIDLRENCGNNFNAFTTTDFTIFTFNRVNSKLEDAFEVASDMLLNSNITKRYVDAEKDVIFEEFKSREDDCKYSISQETYNMILGLNETNRCTIGNKEDLDKITPKSVIEFRKKFYIKDNFVISVVGSESLAKIKKLVKKYFLKAFTKDDAQQKVINEKNVVDKSDYQIFKKETDAVLVSIAVKCVGFNDEVRSPALKIYQDYLSGGIDGKLFKAVRDKGLAYSVFASRSLLSKSGVFSFEFECSKDNVNKVIDEIGKVIADIRKSGIDIKEIKKIKENFIYNISESDVNNTSKALGNLRKHFDGNPFMDKAYINNMLNVSKEVVDEYFVDLFDKSAQVLVTIGGKIKQSEVYNLEQIKQKILK